MAKKKRRVEFEKLNFNHRDLQRFIRIPRIVKVLVVVKKFTVE